VIRINNRIQAVAFEVSAGKSGAFWISTHTPAITAVAITSFPT
jgi:hypothetical protein